MNRRVWCVFLLIVLSGCASRVKRVVAPPANPGLQLSYLDLQPGWRLRVITPLTKSGTYRVGLSGEARQDGNSTLAASDEFLGYETSFYTVRRRGRRGVQIQFTSGEQTTNGVTRPESKPRAELFALSPHANYVRLLYLARVSKSDHNMAVIAARKQELLAGVTAQVQADPQACRDGDATFCSWIPAGIAVRPEARKPG